MPQKSSIMHEQGRFDAHGGLSLFYQSWRPPEAVASLVLVHGLSEHSGRYMGLVNRLVSHGISVYAFDHRGHGHSTNKRIAHVDSWEEYRGDLSAFMGLVSEQNRAAPLFLMGHSMGGLISANYVLHSSPELDGVILSAPPLGEIKIPLYLRLAAQLLSVIRPRTVFQSGLDLAGISRDSEVLEAYRKDPFIHGKVTARWGVEFLRTVGWTSDHAHRFDTPLLILHGDADRLVPITGSRQFFQRVPHRDKHFITYRGGYHESLGDLHREQVKSDISGWLLDRLEGAQGRYNE